MKIQNPFSGFTRLEWVLWISSIVVISASFAIFGVSNIFEVIACLLGCSALIFVAKGHFIGQFIFILFAICYAFVSWEYRYYGEMMTFLFMNLPINIASIVTWIRNPFKKGEAEVKVNTFKGWQWVLMLALTVAVTIAFYFLLSWQGTANIFSSTISVSTSFAAAYLMMFRNPFYAIAYCCNDIILIVLWSLAAVSNISYIPMVVCFVVFFANDLYGFISWQRMKIRQSKVDNARQIN